MSAQHGHGTPAEGSEAGVAAPLTVAQPTGGTLPHPRTREPLSAFQWPCERRVAHGPHPVTDQMLTGPDEFVERECPGVPAHPGTMIGGGYRDDR